SIKDTNFIIKKQDEELLLISDNFEIANGTLNWDKVWDITDRTKYQDGKWSITVKAINENKNESKEEATNIKIDPKSDIPTLNIINPVNDARIPGNLKVVGTAFDDDGIEKVELWVDGEKQSRPCEGKDFWFYDLDTTEMKDGEHSIRVRAYDNKLKPQMSKDYFVKFKLDRRTPVVDIKSMKSGAIVSGVMNISGDAYDDNTIIGMEYSTDDRVSFNDIPFLKYLNNTKTKASWNIRINSENLVDGIQTIWIRAKDGTGSVGYSPLTITVDHKKPVVKIDYPSEKSTVDGTFSALGFVKDNVDVKNVSFAIQGTGSDGKFKDVKLLPGNPYWSYPVNMSKLADGKYKLIAKVEDVAGNIETSFVDVILDRERDKPVLKLKSFKKDDRFSTSLQIFGDISDDDGCKEISIKIFKDGATTPLYTEIIPAKFYFSKEIDLIENNKFVEGKYFVELTPTDMFGVVGNSIKENFIIDREFPNFDEKTINGWAGKYFSSKLNIPVKVIDYGGLRSLTYSIIEPFSKRIITNKKELKFKESKPGIFDADNVVDDVSKMVTDNNMVSLKFEATDFLNNISTISVPIIIDAKAPTIKDIIIDQKAGFMKDQSIDIKDNLMLNDVLIEFITPAKKDPEKTV
ncbi:MAG TPA: Ig-like domain-containing protein, partial [Spirochaetota bacterium]|nr:Ig-like domain-containing protein [Spirochaetota bacterium]